MRNLIKLIRQNLYGKKDATLSGLTRETNATLQADQNNDLVRTLFCIRCSSHTFIHTRLWYTKQIYLFEHVRFGVLVDRHNCLPTFCTQRPILRRSFDSTRILCDPDVVCV